MADTTIRNVTSSENQPFLKGFGTSVAFSGALTGGFGGLSALRCNRGIKNALNQTRLSNEVIDSFIEKSAKNSDIFTKNYAAAKNYEAYSGLVKSAKKAQNNVNIIIARNGKLTLWQRIKNPFKNSCDVIKDYKNKSQEALKAMNEATDSLKEGKEITSAKILSNSLGKNVGVLFKEELLNPMNLIYAAISTYSRIKTEAVPVFKEKGTMAGIKQVFVSAGKSAADIFSNAGFSAIFRIIGSSVGAIISPIGFKRTASAIGGTIGDIFGTFLSNKIITKIFKEDKIEAKIQQKNIEINA